MMGEGAYAVALEPGTNRAVPRADLRKSGEIIELAPGETRSYDLELGVLDGAARSTHTPAGCGPPPRGKGSREGDR